MQDNQTDQYCDVDLFWFRYFLHSWTNVVTHEGFSHNTVVPLHPRVKRRGLIKQILP